ncbi:MAG: L-lactate permease [Bacillota bacterium]
MVMEFNIIYWLISSVPIIVLLYLMVIRKMPAIKAASLALLLTLVSSIFIFKAPLDLILVEAGKTLWSSLSIISVVVTAILLYETSREARAFEVLNHAFSSVAPNELLRIILIGVVFSSFLQGVTGFGVPILVTAPLLIGIGVAPVWAVVVPLVGHCWAGTFGTLALAWHALLLQTDLVYAGTAALYASALLAILNMLAGFTIAWFYGRLQAISKGFFPVLLVSITQGFGQVVVTQLNPDLGVFVPSALSAGVLLLISRLPKYNKSWSVENSLIMSDNPRNKEVELQYNMSIPQAFMPYIVMTVLTLLVLMVDPLNDIMGYISYGPSFPATISGLGIKNPEIQLYAPIKPFTHASFFLALSALAGYAFYTWRGITRKGGINLIFYRTIRKALPSSIAVLSLIGISRLMTGTGQTDILAYGVSSLFGELYAGVSPFIGLLGAFITSSNMSSNILFGGFQYSLSHILGVDSYLLLGAQTAGGSIGTSIAPGNVVLGATAAGILGREGDIIRIILPFVISVTTIFGIITLVLTFLA